MKTSIKIASVAVCAFCLGLTINNFAISSPGNFRVAVVDTNKIVSSSSQVKALNAERDRKIKDLTAFVNRAKAEVQREKDVNKKKALEDKYNKELNTRNEAINRDYATKLKELDRKFTQIITNTAKADKYDIVIKKDSVISGGSDITPKVMQSIR